VLCPSCRADDTKVVDSRLASDGAAIRRRRQCLSCNSRFTTYERVEEVPLLVTKSDGTHEPFDRDKIVSGVRAATKGRGVDDERIADHHRTHAVRAFLLERDGDPDGARDAYLEAARRATSEVERRHLHSRASRLT